VPAWIQRSNEHAQVLLKVVGRLSPETAGAIGVTGVDELTTDFRPGWSERAQEALRGAGVELRKRLAGERDPLVRQDLEILIKAADDSVRERELNDQYDLPFFEPAHIAFGGMRALLDDQVEAARRPRALVRLRRYAGLEAGTEPLARQAEARIRERLGAKGLLPPIRAEVEQSLADSAFYLDGIGKLLDKYKLGGADALGALRRQVAAYESFVRKELLPRARTDFRLPAEVYAFRLDQVGVALPPARLAQEAHQAFDEIQRQMQELAPKVARQKGIQATDYRDVIRALKKDQITGPAILPHYQARLGQLEAIIRDHRLVTLPTRAARIRLASEAESASIPAPNMHPPPLIGNTGQQGEFLLPLKIPARPGSGEKTQSFDDFTFDAASWTLTAHEARPGHELQFAAMMERGVSVARAVFAFNSTNVEGWGLYAEWISFPFMPPDGQLISLQHRMMRAARAFLDPELQSGKVTPDGARQLLTKEVVLSPAMANQEVERYTFRAPGQATAYFYGYTLLRELRTEVERAQGARFVAQRFHDFVLGQGLLPPALLRKAVMTDFVGAAGRGKTN
jgi:hypothetical protein